MVWAFGGGLCGGYAGNRYYNGSALALRHGVIVVTVSYRIGALGFLTTRDDHELGSGGMNGINDVIVALKWVQKNIRYFGGDPDRVTLAGQSSGAYLTCTLCVSPAAKGLFKHAILQSGPCIGGPPGKGWGPRSLSFGIDVTARVFEALNVSSLNPNPNPNPDHGPNNSRP